MKYLANEFVTVVKSPDPQTVYCYSPGLLKLKSGRIIVTMDFGGPGEQIARMEGACKRHPNGDRQNAGCVFVSDDDGATWRQTAAVPMLFMRPFAAGNTLYVIGACRDMGIIRSDDNGETWSEVFPLTEGELWHQAPANVWYEDDRVYMVMERMTHNRECWPVCGIAPVLMRGNIHTDLTRRENWTFASELVFDEQVDQTKLTDFGVMFYDKQNCGDYYMGRNSCGWLETNVVRLKKENDVFYDPTGHTFHLFMRTWAGGLPWAGAMAKVVEKEDGSMETMFETTPSGNRMVFVNIPGGGQSKFHILYDEKTRTYWLLTNQFIDTMTDFSRMTQNDCNGYDRSRLVLYYSYNCFDWIFAGIVAVGNNLRQSRSYASMQFDGEDLLVLSRSGDEHALCGHETNCITLHRVKDFRSLIDKEYTF